MKHPDQNRIGRAWSNKVVEMALASYPGFYMTGLPTDAAQIGVYWPALVPSDAVSQRVVIGEETVPVPHTQRPASFTPAQRLAHWRVQQALYLIVTSPEFSVQK